MIKLSKNQVGDLKNFVEDKLVYFSCDHTLKFAKEWAHLNNYDFNNLIDVLDENGGFCDCEVVMNVPDEEDLVLPTDSYFMDFNNPWKLPKDYYISDPEKKYTKILKSTEKCRTNCYAEKNEILVPAPFGAKPKKRIRRSIHFFIGILSGLPNEYGFVVETKPTKATEFSKMIRDLNNPEFSEFSNVEADFYLSKLENLNIDTPVGTHFLEKSGLTGKGELLRIHKIIFGKREKY